ncbi:hypothetical protein HJC23_010750 [Cyclotella cryptica]|uniref:Heme-binding protein n=1 Tax=Cyclotella cryptica TaxID=29204 RepID=A0ABD3PUV3_9STRA
MSTTSEVLVFLLQSSLRGGGGGGGGWIRWLKATKDLVAQELLRQNPKARLNKKNQTFDQLSSRIRPLTDSRDIEFILKEERKIRQKFYEVVTANRSKDDFINKHATLGQGAFAENNQTKGSHAEVSKEKLNAQKAESPKILRQNIQISLGDKEHILCPDNKRQKTTGESQRDDRKSDAVSDCANEALFPSSYELSSVLADKAMHAAINFAVLRDWKITVAIVDAGGSPILMKRLDGASSASYDVALGKARNAARFIKSTGEIEKDAQGLDSVLHDSVLAPFISKRGGCPIVISDCSRCIGAIGVSGAPTATNDEQVANAGVTFITCLFSSQKR